MMRNPHKGKDRLVTTIMDVQYHPRETILTTKPDQDDPKYEGRLEDRSGHGSDMAKKVKSDMTWTMDNHLMDLNVDHNDRCGRGNEWLQFN